MYRQKYHTLCNGVQHNSFAENADQTSSLQFMCYKSMKSKI